MRSVCGSLGRMGLDRVSVNKEEEKWEVAEMKAGSKIVLC